jgi:hypothetical protein
VPSLPSRLVGALLVLSLAWQEIISVLLESEMTKSTNKLIEFDCDYRQLVMELSTLTELAKRSAEFRKFLIDRPHCISDLCAVDFRDSRALGTRKLRITFKMSDSLSKLVLATGVGTLYRD